MTEQLRPMQIPTAIQSVAAHQSHINKLWSEISVEVSVIRNLLINREVRKDGRFYKVTKVEQVGRIVQVKGIEIGKKREVILGAAINLTEIVK